MKKTLLLLALLAAPAFATDWTIQDENGNWIDNPECTSAHCRETGEPDPLPEPEPEPPAEYEDDGDQPRFTAKPQCCAKLPDGQKLIIVDGKIMNPEYRIWCAYGGTLETTPVEKECGIGMHPIGKLWGEE